MKLWKQFLRYRLARIKITATTYTEENNMKDITTQEHGNHSHMTITEKVSTAFVFLGVGAAIGATLALLFAPKKGSELRVDIADTARKGYDATVEKATELKDQSLKAVLAVKERAGAVIDLAADKFSTGTDIIEDVISTTTGALTDGIERMQNESGVVPTGRTVRKPTNIM